jgi:hypothetical protein
VRIQDQVTTGPVLLRSLRSVETHAKGRETTLKMKRIVFFLLALSCCTPALRAQVKAGDRFEAGIFADYFRLGRTSPAQDFLGAGARFGYNMRRNVQLEAEMSYDFTRSFTNSYTNGFVIDLRTTHLRTLHALVGPKFDIRFLGPIRAFGTFKVGFVNFHSSTASVPQGFTDSLGAVTTGDTRPSLYPGGGLEGHIGPIGLRLEVGDDIYLDNGMHHNWKGSIGPTFRF